MIPGAIFPNPMSKGPTPNSVAVVEADGKPLASQGSRRQQQGLSVRLVPYLRGSQVHPTEWLKFQRCLTAPVRNAVSRSSARISPSPCNFIEPFQPWRPHHVEPDKTH